MSTGFSSADVQLGRASGGTEAVDHSRIMEDRIVDITAQDITAASIFVLLFEIVKLWTSWVYLVFRVLCASWKLHSTELNISKLW